MATTSQLKLVKVSSHQGSGYAYVAPDEPEVFYCPTCKGHERVCPMQPWENGHKVECSDPKCGTTVVVDPTKAVMPSVGGEGPFTAR